MPSGQKKGLLVLLFSLLVLAAFLLARFWPAKKKASFTDPGLAAAVRQATGLASTSPLTAKELAQITGLNAADRQIESLQGIELLQNLVELDLENNNIKDLTPLSGLKKLQVLNLRNNGIINLQEVNFSAVTQLQLRELSLRHNIRLNSAGKKDRLQDISLISKLTSLEWLELRDNHIDDLTPLESLVQLKYLDIRENRFIDIESLAFLHNLEELNLRDNEISSIQPLAGLVKLNYLNLHSALKIASLRPLENLVGLETLIIRGVNIRGEEDVLASLTCLKRLNAADTDLTDLEPLTGLFLLEELDLSGNKNIKTLAPLNKLPSLKQLIPPDLTED